MPRKVYANDSARELARKNKLLIKDIPSKTEKVTLKEVKNYISEVNKVGVIANKPTNSSKPTKSLVSVNFTVNNITQTKKNYELIKKWFEMHAPSVAYGFPLDKNSLQFKIKGDVKRGYYINAVFIVNGIEAIDYETTTEAILDVDDDGNHPVTVGPNRNIISLTRMRHDDEDDVGSINKEILIKGKAIEPPKVTFM